MQNIRPHPLKILIIAIRPFSLPASTMPVIFGTIAAVLIGGAPLNLPLFIMAFFAMVMIHSGANMINDVYDFRKGLDRVPTPGSGAIVRGYMTPEGGLIISIILIATGIAIGSVIASLVGSSILILGVIGITIGVLYTVGPFALKYHALGDIAVFFDFGILGAMGAWTVQTGTISWLPALWAVPMSMLVVAILHANNWRDIQGDRNRDITTVASLLGDGGSFIYYCFLVFGSFGFFIILIVLTRLLGSFSTTLPFTFLITFLTFPYASKLVRYAKLRHYPEHEKRFLALDAGTAMLSLMFGLLCTGAVLLQELIKR